MESVPMEIISKLLDELNLRDKINFGFALSNSLEEVKRKTKPIVTYNEEKQRTEYVWFYHGKRDKQKNCYDNGEIEMRWYDENGLKHKEKGPAYLLFHKDGQRLKEKWYIHGMKNSTNGPATKEWYADGRRKKESHFLMGKRHHLKAPSLIRWNKNHLVTEEIWYKHGEFHRKGAPALKSFCDEDFNEKEYLVRFVFEERCYSERWYYNGELHRTGDKPAVVCRNINKQIVSQEFYKNDQDVHMARNMNQMNLPIRNIWDVAHELWNQKEEEEMREIWRQEDERQNMLQP